jgi:GDP-L-fucose synthase
VGEDVSIAELAALVARVVGFDGEIVYDRSRPDGTPRKLLDISRVAALGWRARIGLEEGVRDTYAWYCRHLAGEAGQVGPVGTAQRPPAKAGA